MTRLSLRTAAPRAYASTLFLILVLAALPACAAPAGRAAVPGIDRMLAEVYPAAEPGAAVLVMKDGEVLLRKGYGMANLELGVPIAPDMVFEIGSVTKQFTSMAVMMLAERGKLSVEDDISRYLPDFPTGGRKITIENLLTHTSGVPNFTDLPDWIPRMRQDLSVEELIGLFRGRPLDFTPGERFSYSNSGYELLGAILEKVSGKPYGRFIEEEIFRPLGMTSSRYNSPQAVIPRRVSGYEGDAETGWSNAPYLSMTIPYAAGALVSSVDDLARWDRALNEGTLVSKASLERMFTPYRLTSGERTRYGYGWSLAELDGRKVIEHNGGIPGFLSEILRIPEERLLVVVLSNNPAKTPRPDTLALRIAARALGNPLEDRPTVKLSAAELEEYAGAYLGPGGVQRISRDGDHLYVQRIGVRRAELLATAKDDFFATDSYSRLRFQRDPQGKVTSLEVTPRGGTPEVARKSDEPKPGPRQGGEAAKVDPALFDAYAGRYQLAPGAILVVTREGDHLYAQLAGQGRQELLPASDTEFFVPEADSRFTFVRGADGKAGEVVFRQPGREVRAPRVE